MISEKDIDAEIEAMSRINRILIPLHVESRERVIDWALSRTRVLNDTPEEKLRQIDTSLAEYDKKRAELLSARDKLTEKSK